METTPCIRCGKMRVLKKKWTEKINGSLTTYTMSVCPDPDCQKIVEEQIETKNEKLRLVHEQSLKRRANFKRKKVVVAAK